MEFQPPGGEYFRNLLKENQNWLKKNLLCSNGTAQLLFEQTDNAHYTLSGFADSEDKSCSIIGCQWRKLIDGNLQGLRLIRNSRYAKNALQIKEVLESKKSLCQKMVQFLGKRTTSEEQEINFISHIVVNLFLLFQISAKR